jgi:hypothetical protein
MNAARKELLLSLDSRGRTPHVPDEARHGAVAVQLVQWWGS